MARELRADAYEQMGYQAEGPQRRNIYLTPLSLPGGHPLLSEVYRRCASSTSLTICQKAMRSRSASVVSAKKRRAMVSSLRSRPAACSAIQARSIRLWAIKTIADSMSEPVQSPSRLNTPRPISSDSSGLTSPIAT